MPKGYTDQEAIENYLLHTIDGGFLEQLDHWIAAIETHIEQITGRVFIADEAASTRLFMQASGQKLPIDDAVEITKVEMGDEYGENFTEIAAGDFQTLPLNVLPKNMIGLKRRVWPIGIHRVTAKWGYTVACPSDITFVATVLVAGILNSQLKTGTAKKSESIGHYKVEYSDAKGITDFETAQLILSSYRKITI